MSFTVPGGQVPKPPSSLKRPSPHTTERPSSRPEPHISVVLSSSPHRPAFHEPVVKHYDGPKPAVISNLSPQFKKQKQRQTPVPLPFIPGMSRPLQQQAKGEAPVKLPPRPATTTTTTAAPAPAPAPATASGATTPTTARGRPKGWKPGMSYAAMRGHERPPAARPRPAAGAAKRRGRRPKQASPPPRELYHALDPPFVAFLCEWRGCRAELHNLETLRRHVGIVHLEEEEEDEGEEWCCMWGKCGRGEPVTAFSGLPQLESHMEGAHMEPFAWHVGDGPANRSGRGVGGRGGGRGPTAEQGGDGIPSYLKDAEGNQVTPSVRDQELEDYMTWRENRRKLKELLLERDRSLPPEEEEDGGGEGEGLVV